MGPDVERLDGRYTPLDELNDKVLQLYWKLKNCADWFSRVQKDCPHRTWESDCAHPKIEMSCMSCCVRNCPFLEYM